MSIIVTGGTGIIGSETVRLLLEKGEDDLFVFDIIPSTKLLADIENQIEIVQGDLGNFSHVLDLVKSVKPKAVYHLGAMLSVPSDTDPAASIRANALGTFHVLEAARLFEVPQVLFSSSIGTYGIDLKEEVIDDYTLQRPMLFYGATKVFCEHMGLFFKRKYGLDFRGVRYPSIVSPGVKTPGVVQYTSWVIEECAKGKPYTIYVKPETKCPVMYFKDSALAIVSLAKAPIENIKMVNYLLAGVVPIASAQELVNMVRQRIPNARIDFQPDMEIQKIVDKFLLPLDDTAAREEWDWKPKFSHEDIVDDFLEELKAHPERYE